MIAFPHAHAKQGFTLVELSIVLVIIGLILGGVMVGRSMIRSMQVNRVASDLEAYAAAAQMFVDKYQGLPGDMANATTFWSSTIVANGNGNGQINYASAASVAGEEFGAWEQMALAGLIKGKFSGVAGGSGVDDATVGINVPASSMSGGGYQWRFLGTSAASAYYYDGSYGNIIFFGRKVASGPMHAAGLSPEEAYQIDAKIDDGLPGVGNVRTMIGAYATNCATTSIPTTAAYNITAYSGIACQLVFVSGL
jgi:prepilin-type N-terminal cleavage/methylation domain-containing protein